MSILWSVWVLVLLVSRILIHTHTLYSGWDPTSDQWRQESLEELAQKELRGLSFEIYALRDIQPGEEIFIDYGQAWERAWHQHVQRWKPPPTTPISRDQWVLAKQANEEGANKPILAELTGRKDDFLYQPQHPYLMTACVYWSSELDQDPVYQTPNPQWHANTTTAHVLKQYADDGSQYEYYTTKGYANHYDGMHWPCTVLWKQEEHRNSYVVRIHPSPLVDRSELPWYHHEVPRLLVHYPRSSIRYFVKPYASDQHLPVRGLCGSSMEHMWCNNKIFF